MAQNLFKRMKARRYTWLEVPPTVQAKLDGVDVLCLVDSGSMVSFVTEEFYNKKLKRTSGHVREDGQMLTLRAANGLEIPYLGYLELTIEVDGVKVPSCGVLVLKDTPATSSSLMPSLGVQKTLPLVCPSCWNVSSPSSSKFSGKCSCHWSSLWS